MKALVHLPDPTTLRFVSSVRLEVGDEVGIVGEMPCPNRTLSSGSGVGGQQITSCPLCGGVGASSAGPRPSQHRPVSAVVATSTITEAEQGCDECITDPLFVEVCGPHWHETTPHSWAKPEELALEPCPVWRYSLAPLRECDPITDLPCRNPIHPSPGVSSWDECPSCSDALWVPLPEVPTGEAVLL